LGAVGPEQPANLPENTPLSTQSDAKSDAQGANDTKTPSLHPDFADALRLIASLPLSDIEKAEAVRRLLTGGKGDKV